MNGVPSVDDAWTQGTKARLAVMDNEILLQRNVTNAEKREFLAAIDRPDFHEDNTQVGLIPELDEVHFLHTNRDERRIESITAVKQKSSVGLTKQQGTTEKSHSEVSLKVTDSTTHTPSDFKQATSTPSKSNVVSPAAAPPGCKAEDLHDLFICIADYADCGYCFLATSLTGPVGIACLIIVCFDGGLSIVREHITDWGCWAFGEGLYDCLRYIVDEYGLRTRLLRGTLSSHHSELFVARPTLCSRR